MLENLRRSAAAINQIIKSNREHKAKMKMIKNDSDLMLTMVDEAFDNLRR